MFAHSPLSHIAAFGRPPPMMADGSDVGSSPPGTHSSNQETLEYYKAQYEQLEAELADFQASSRDLEAELEKDVEAAEKRERLLQEKVEALGYEVEEWKSKCKQSKAEANAAQNTLQKEITTLRDANRTLQLKLRDIEVANDDFERQARNTTSSLEDLESKYNVAIERGVMMEEEIKAGEQEREALRIETQRLRDELSDLKVEAEIRQDKLRHAEAATQRRQLRKPTPIGIDIPRPQSSISEQSPSTTTASSPTLATPPTKSASSGASDAPTPPSPPVSDKSVPSAITTPATLPTKTRLSFTGSSVTPRPGHYSSRVPRHSRGPSMPANNGFSTPSVNRRTTLNASQNQRGQALPSSSSLSQVRELSLTIGKLQQRIHAARSKLPAPTATPPGASPRSGSALSQSSYIPASVTVRSHKKRTGESNYSCIASLHAGKDASDLTPIGTRQLNQSSSNMPPPSPSLDSTQLSSFESRPNSRASQSSRQSLHHASASHSAARAGSRPTSRQSGMISGARTPLGNYSHSTASSETRARPRSSMSGSYATIHGHGHSASVSRLSNYNIEEAADGGDVLTPTPSRRTTLNKEGTGILPPRTLSKRQSAGGAGGTIRRTSSGPGVGDMGPPMERKTGVKKLSGVGETY